MTKTASGIGGIYVYYLDVVHHGQITDSLRIHRPLHSVFT